MSLSRSLGAQRLSFDSDIVLGTWIRRTEGNFFWVRCHVCGKNYVARIFQSLPGESDGCSTAKERYSIHKSFTSACRRGGKYTYSCNPPFQLEIGENPLALVTYCIIPSNPSSSSSKSRGGDNKKLMINQNTTDQRLREMILGGPSILTHLKILLASPARYQSRSCPQKEPLGPSSTVSNCVRSGMDEAILHVSERSLQTQNDFSILWYMYKHHLLKMRQTVSPNQPQVYQGSLTWNKTVPENVRFAIDKRFVPLFFPNEKSDLNQYKPFPRITPNEDPIACVLRSSNQKKI